MEPPRIAPLNPTGPAYGVGALGHDRDRRNQRDPRSFEKDLDQDLEDQDTGSPGVAEDDTAAHHPKKPLPRGLQDSGGIIRKDEEDGQLHVDLVV